MKKLFGIFVVSMSFLINPAMASEDGDDWAPEDTYQPTYESPADTEQPAQEVYDDTSSPYEADLEVGQ